MTWRKFFYLPHVLGPQEKRLILFLVFALVFSMGGLAVRNWLKFTRPAPQIGKSYAEGLLKEPRNINPVFAAQDADRDISRLLFSGLLTYSGKGELETDLAETYEISPDGKTYTVFLKKGVFWHDGAPLTAEDVIFTVKTIQNPQYKSVLRANWQGVGAEKLDDYTVRFTLRAPYAPFIENLTTGIIPKHLWESVGPEQAILHELNLKPVGSGPYKFDWFKQAKDGTILRYTLARNPRYHRGGPYLKKITFVFFKNEEEAIKAFRKGLVDGFGPISASRLQEQGSQKAMILAVSMPRIFGIFFNSKKAELLADKKVRQAIARALNREEIVKKAASGGAVPSASPLPFSGRNKTTESVSAYDPESAQKLLEESGWKDNDGDGIREKKIRQKGKEAAVPLRFVLTTSDWPELLRSADIIKTALKDVGIDIAVEKRTLSELESEVIRPRNFEMLLFGQVYGYEPDLFAFWHSSQIKDPGLNVALYGNKKVDQLLEEARRLQDEKARNKKHEEAGLIIAQDLPAVFLYSQLYLYLLPADLQGVSLEKISLPADRFNEINKWYRETKRVFK